MKTLIASALVTLALLSTAVTAQAAVPGGYPPWAQNAFDIATN